MYYNVLKLEDLVETKEERYQRKTLLESHDSCLEIVALKKDEIIERHASANDAIVYVVDGKIEMHFEAEKFTISKGEIILFKKGDEHKVLALKDSKFLLIKI